MQSGCLQQHGSVRRYRGQLLTPVTPVIPSVCQPLSCVSTPPSTTTPPRHAVPGDAMTSVQQTPWCFRCRSHLCPCTKVTRPAAPMNTTAFIIDHTKPQPPSCPHLLPTPFATPSTAGAGSGCGSTIASVAGVGEGEDDWVMVDRHELARMEDDDDDMFAPFGATCENDEDLLQLLSC